MKKQIGVYICHCGTNIAATVDVKKLVQFASTLPYVKRLPWLKGPPILEASCPSKAARQKHSTQDQVLAEVEGLVA